LLLDGVKDATLKGYEDEGYNLTNITAKIKIYAPDTITRTITGISFTPPTHGISLSVSDTKTIDETISYTVTKTNSQSKSRSCVFTQVKDSVKNPFNDGNLVNKLNKNSSLVDTKSLSLNGCAKGDYVKAEWEEELNGRTFHKNTDIVSIVKGHRYYLEDPVQICINGEDKTYELFNKKFVHVDPGGSSVDIAVSGINITHENFSSHDNSADDVPTDHRRYPIISSLTLYVVPSNTWPSYKTQYWRGSPIKIYYKEIPEVEAPVTYPNGGSVFADYIANLPNNNAFSISYGGTTISLSDIVISTNVTVTGTYQIFLVVKDEYDQCSVFNITSNDKFGTTKTYRTNFGAGI
jgi:hypothetical protein